LLHYTSFLFFPCSTSQPFLKKYVASMAGYIQILWWGSCT